MKGEQQMERIDYSKVNPNDFTQKDLMLHLLQVSQHTVTREEVKDDISALDKKMDISFANVDKRFDSLETSINQRFEQIDKRFEQVDKRFEQVDKRFEQVNEKLDRVLERIDVKIDKGLSENRSISLKLFTFAMIFSAISMTGLLGRIANIF